MKSYVIRAINNRTGAHIYSHTNNPKQRQARLEYNILSINGKGTAVHERFEPFIGAELTDVTFELYKQVA